MSAATITKTIFLNAPREKVWAFLTEKDKLALWFHPADTDLVEGKPYALLSDAADATSRICWGSVLTMSRPSALSYTFTIKPMGDVVTTVAWTLDELAGGTRVTMVHEGFDAFGKEGALGLLMALEEGWDKHFAKLRVAAAT